jgi:hypothetical protein
MSAMWESIKRDAEHNSLMEEELTNSLRCRFKYVEEDCKKLVRF